MLHRLDLLEWMENTNNGSRTLLSTEEIIESSQPFNVVGAAIRAFPVLDVNVPNEDKMEPFGHTDRREE